MTGRKAFSILTCFSVLPLALLSCASTQEIRRPPTFRLVDVSLSKAVEDRASIPVPQNPTNVFSPGDPEVIAFLKLKNLSGVHTLKWDWFDPQGNLYYSTGDFTIKSAEGKYVREVTTWHKLSIRGEKAGKLTGNWTLNVYLDKEMVAVRTFRIGDEAPSVSRPPH